MIEVPSGKATTLKATLFIPRLDPSYAIWMGEIKTPNAFRQKYRVDAVRYVDELQPAIEAAAAGGLAVHTLRGINSDSGTDIARALPAAGGLPAGRAAREDVLYEALAECRVAKSAAELQLTAWQQSPRPTATVRGPLLAAWQQSPRPTATVRGPHLATASASQSLPAAWGSPAV